MFPTPILIFRSISAGCVLRMISSRQMQPQVENALRRHARTRSGRDRQPGRETHGRPLLACAIRKLAPNESFAPTSRRRMRGSNNLPPTCIAGQSRQNRRRQIRARSADRHRRLGARTAIHRRRARLMRRPVDIFFFDNTDPDGFDRVFDKIGDELAHTLGRRHFEIRRHEGNAQRHAGSRRRASRKRGWISAKHAVAVTGVGSELDKYAETTRLAGAFSDVRLGRRPHFGDERGRAGAGGAAGFRHRRFSRGRGGDGCAHARGGRATRTPRCFSP